MLSLKESSIEMGSFGGDLSRKEKKKVSIRKRNDDIVLTSTTLSPSFMADANESLSRIVPDSAVFRHPAIQVLGILDRILGELG